MTTKTKWVVLALSLVMAGLGGKAYALDADTGSFVIRIQPNVDVGVTVDTTGAAWAGDTDLNLNSGDLNTTYLLGTGVLLTVTGNFSNQELTLEAAKQNTWNLDTDEVASADDLRLYAMIGANQGTAPAAANITTAGNLLTTGAVFAGQASGAEDGSGGGTYEFTSATSPQYQDVDGLAVGTTRRLWLRADTPLTTTTDAQQAFTITVTAYSGTTN